MKDDMRNTIRSYLTLLTLVSACVGNASDTTTVAVTNTPEAVWQRYCEAMQRSDAPGATALQSNQLNKDRDLSKPLSMKLGQHMIPRRFEILRKTTTGDKCIMEFRGWFQTEKGGDEAAGLLTATLLAEDGGWKVHSTLLNLDSFEKPANAPADDAAQLERAKKLAAGLAAPLHAELKQLLQQGKYLPACKRYVQATGENLPTAQAVIQLLEKESQ